MTASVMLVSLEKTKLRLRFDDSAADPDIELAIRGASRLVLNYIGDKATPFFDSYGAIEVDTAGVATDMPEDIQNATMYLAGWMVRNPDSDSDKSFEQGYLPLPVIAMLYQYRVPTVA
jgi:hypothetical protein